MPADILDTPYPEKLVSVSTRHWRKSSRRHQAEEFLTGQALIEYNRVICFTSAFPTCRGMCAGEITQLSYAPQTEAFDAS